LHALRGMGVSDEAFQAQLSRYVRLTGQSLLSLGVFNYSQATVNAVASAAGNPPFIAVPDVHRLFRTAEFAIYRSTACYQGGVLQVGGGDCESVAYYDIKSDNAISSNINMLKTLVVMIVLCAGVMTFTTDAEKLLIRPIERMVDAIRGFTDTPLAGLVNETTKEEEETFETMMLQKVLDKTAGMLRIAFGEAGSDIIRMNLGTEGELDPMIPGKKVHAAFGFCDIRQFTDATECLQEEVMVFVNKIGAIVHNVCHQYHGAANKNIGDAFLICWKVSKLAMRGAKTLDAIADGEDGIIQQEVDNALMSFLKCTILLEKENNNRRSTLGKYQAYTSIQHRFPEGFRVRMGYGLHIGWAIEGAIGSRYKIDASYLSPHVNIAARLEAATKQYGVPLLLSSSFFRFLTPAAQQMCRQLDCVQVKGSDQPIGLYTCDITNTAVTCFNKDPSDVTDVPRISANFADKDLQQLQVGIPDGFRVNFNSGVKSYLTGEWESAHDALARAAGIWPEDGPCQTLLSHMAKTQNKAPADWAGSRSLTEK
jgi:class 3 adenylate cyclase